MATLKDIDRSIELKSAYLLNEDVDDSVVWIAEPVGFREFCESTAYLGVFPLSELQYRDIESLIGTEPKKTFSPSRANDLLILVYGKGGGKGAVASRLFLYIIYLLLSLADPQEFLFVAHDKSWLTLLNVARKTKQAERVFFKYFTSYLVDSRWFKSHFDIKEQNKWRSRVVKRSHYMGVISVQAGTVIFPKNIQCITESTENESWEGYNLVLFLLDEISGFKSEKELETANNMFNTARSSVASRVSLNFRGMGIITSYPRQEEGDVALELLKQSYVMDRMVGSLAYPWHSKGMHNFSGETFVVKHPRLDAFFGVDGVGIDVPVEYKGEFDQDIGDSITKYLCIPPKTAGGWLDYPERLQKLIVSRDPSSPNYRPRLFETEDIIEDTFDEVGRRVRYLSKRLISCSARSQFDRYQLPRVAWLDGANKHCEAVIAIGHLEMRNINTNEGVVPIEVVIQDDELVWRPDASKGIQTSLINVESWLTNIIPKNVRLVSVGADNWHSAILEETLRKLGVQVETHNLSNDDYDLVKRQIYLSACSFINGEAPGQLVNLVNGSGNQGPQRKAGFLKDAADAVCGIIRLLVGRDSKTGRKSPGRRASAGRMPVGITGGGSVISSPARGSSNSPGGMGIRDIRVPTPAQVGSTFAHGGSASSDRNFPTSVR